MRMNKAPAQMTGSPSGTDGRIDLAESRMVLMQRMIERSREAVRDRQFADALRQAARRRVGLDAEAHDPFVLIVPAQRSGVVAVTAERRQRLRRHIAALLRRMKAKGGAGEADETPPPPPAPSAVARQACASCRGRCCGHGGERAYLTEATLARVAASGDRPAPGRILRRYMACVPREAVDDSCIFHGTHGCTLDRALRSDTCNNHYCTAMKAYLRDAPMRETRDVLVAAEDHGKLHDACLIAAEASH